MWVVEGLTHRYPTKVLAELLSTCPQYCGHCTRMDLVGNDVPQVEKLKFHVPQKDRHQQILDYLQQDALGARRRRLRRRYRQPAHQPARAVRQRAARYPEHSRHPAGVQGPDRPAAALPAGQRRSQGLERLAKKAFERGVDLALHTHANNAQQVTPLVGKATKQAAGDRLPRRPEPGGAAPRRERDLARTCSSSASCCSITPRSCRTTSTCAT